VREVFSVNRQRRPYNRQIDRVYPLINQITRSLPWPITPYKLWWELAPRQLVKENPGESEISYDLPRPAF